MKISQLLNEQAEHAAKQAAELQKVLAILQKMLPHIQKVSQESHYEFEAIVGNLHGLDNQVEKSNLGDAIYDVKDAIKTAIEATGQANGAIYQIEVELKQSIRRISNEIEDIQSNEEWERRYGRQVEENSDVEEDKASRALCLGSKPDDELGASQLSSCKSQGFRARDGKKSHLVGKKRITVGGHKIKGKKYGGPLPDYGTRKDQR
jgi:hypothetical protein